MAIAKSDYLLIAYESTKEIFKETTREEVPVVPVALVMGAQRAHRKNSSNGNNNSPRIDGAKVESASGPWPQHHLRLLHRATYRPHLRRSRHCNPPMLRLRKEVHRSSSLEEA